MKNFLKDIHEYWVIRHSGMFNREYYLRNNLDVARECVDPIIHYIRHGWREGRNPSPYFDTKWYLQAYPDLLESDTNPFTHYLTTNKLSLSALKQISRCPQFNSNNVTKNGNDTVLLCAHIASQHLFGAERSFIDVARGLSSNNYNIVITLPKYVDEYVRELLNYAYRIYVLPYKWWGQAEENNEIAGEFENIIEIENISAVHVNTIMIREPLSAAKRKNVPGIVHVRELISGDETLTKVIGKSQEQIINTVVEKSDYIIANSEATANAFNKSGQTAIIPNSIDTEEFNIENNIIENEIKVAMISSNIPKKGISDFIEAARICSRLPNLKFLLIGPCNYHIEKLKEEQAAGALPANVVFSGYRDSSIKAISESNIVVNFSHFSESFGRTVLEAMAARRPVIVYDHGAIPELVKDGINGFVVPYKDVSIAAKRIKTLCNDPSLIKKMGNAGREIALARYSHQAFSKHIGNLYEQILQKKKTSSKPSVSTGKKTRIAYFLWHFPAPSETFVLNELRLLVNSGHDVLVFCRQSPYPDFKPDFKISWQQVKSPEELSQKLIETGRQIVHSHFVFPTVTQMVWPACEIAKIPFTFIAHAQDIFRYTNDSQNRISEVCSSPYCERVVVPGKFHKQFLLERNVPERKIYINPQGIDPVLYEFNISKTRIAKPVKNVCSIQRYVEKKGLINLLKAAKDLAKRGIKINLHGYGPLEDSYKEFIQSNGITNVHLHGAVNGKDGLVKVLLENDLFICPSIRAADGDMDGIPTILMEAMAVGLPVITTPMASIPDLVQDGINGLYCRPDDASPIIEAVDHYCSMPLERRIALIQDARNTIEKRFNITALLNNLMGIWEKREIDIILVTWNNLPELKEVVNRIFKYTGMNFKLFVCDNNSSEDVQQFLEHLENIHLNVTIIRKNVNSYVGPGINTALSRGSSEYSIYICAKEGFILKENWEKCLVEYMDENPKAGLAGTLGYSPSYFHGKDYISNLKDFSKFRNQDFAHNNPERMFKHVQGGLFIMRRKMYDEIGGFSEEIPHDYTDVEYSYYAESCDWELGEIPEIISLYIKARPGIFSRVTEKTLAVHPGSFENIKMLDKIANSETVLCNLCEWMGSTFVGNGAAVCPKCGSRPEHRTVWRYLAESVLTFRRLPGLYVNPHPCMSNLWQTQFQGRIINSDKLENEIRGKRLNNNNDSLSIVYLENAVSDDVYLNERLFSELCRVLAPNGILLIHQSACNRNFADMDLLRQAIEKAQLKIIEQKRYVSQVVRYDWSPLFVCKKK